MRVAALALLALAMASGARSQTPDRLAATVTQIAGTDAYLDVGREDGLATGDTLRAFRDGAFLGRFRVVSAASASTVVTFVAETFAVTRGETLEVELPVREAEPTTDPEPPPPVAERPSILDTPASGARGPARTPIRVTGRLQVGADALQSTTVFGPTETSRQFTTPFAALRADVSGLPGGWRARVHGRGSTLMASGDTRGGSDVWLYALSLDGSVGGAGVEVGRFVPRRERFTGAWDGADIRLGSDGLGGGLVAGWRPTLAAGVPDFDRPGTVVYAHARQRRGAVRTHAQASGGIVWGGDGTPFAGAMAGVSGTARGTRFRLSAEALGDARVGEPWEVARLALRGSLSPSRALTVRSYARQYRPSVIDDASLLFRFASSRAIGSGATVAVGPATLRGDLALRASGAGDDWSQAVTGGASVRRLGSLPVGLDASATVWQRDGRDAVYASAGLTGRHGGARGTLAYRLSTSPAGDATLTTHGLSASAHLPLSRRLALSLRASTASGDGLAQTRLYSALWVRL